MREPWPADRDEALRQRAREIAEGALADAALMAAVRKGIAASERGEPPVPFRSLREELQRQRTGTDDSVERTPASRDEVLERRRREIVEGALADTTLMEAVREGIAACERGEPAMPFRQLRDELRRGAGDV